MNIEDARINMIKKQVRISGLTDKKLLRLLTQVPREDMVPESHKAFAFADMMIPLNGAKALLSPFLEGRILQTIAPEEMQNVLIIGAAGAYLAAVYAHNAKSVTLVDDDEALVKSIQTQLESLGFKNAHCQRGDLSQGWQSNGPFDVIIISGAISDIPESLKDALNQQGQMIAITGEAPTNQVSLVTHKGQGWLKTSLFETDVPALNDKLDKAQFKF